MTDLTSSVPACGEEKYGSSSKKKIEKMSAYLQCGETRFSISLKAGWSKLKG